MVDKKIILDENESQKLLQYFSGLKDKDGSTAKSTN